MRLAVDRRMEKKQIIVRDGLDIGHHDREGELLLLWKWCLFSKYAFYQKNCVNMTTIVRIWTGISFSSVGMCRSVFVGIFECGRWVYLKFNRLVKKNC